MTLALRSHAIVDNNHTITLPGLKLKPGVRVEMINSSLSLTGPRAP